MEFDDNYQAMFNCLILQGHRLPPHSPNNPLKTHNSRRMVRTLTSDSKVGNSPWKPPRMCWKYMGNLNCILALQERGIRRSCKAPPSSKWCLCPLLPIAPPQTSASLSVYSPFTVSLAIWLPRTLHKASKAWVSTKELLTKNQPCRALSDLGHHVPRI